MRVHRTVAAGAAMAVAALSFGAGTASATNAPVKPKFVVSALGLIGHQVHGAPSYTYDVTKAAANLRFRVQVKDFDRKFDPKSVSVVVVEKVSGTPATTFTVKTTLVGKSPVTSNWHGTITVPKGSPAATYCLAIVKVDPNSTAASPVRALAKGLQGRDCFTVIDTAPTPV